MPSLSSTFLYFSTALIGTTLALPTTSSAVSLDRRSCQVSYPSRMTEMTPYETSETPIWDFCVSSNTRVRYVEFNDIPSSARGACQLEFIFPPGYSVAGSGSHQVNVWRTDRGVAESDTWASAPKATPLFGTVTLNSQPIEQTRLVVNSEDCASMKNFKVTIADNDNSSSVTYTQQYPPESPVAGMRIVHSC